MPRRCESGGTAAEAEAALSFAGGRGLFVLIRLTGGFDRAPLS